MRPNIISMDLANANAAGYANDSAAGNAGSVVLAVNSAPDGLAHRVTWVPATGTGVSGNITVTGTDADGKPQSELVATNGANSVSTTGFYKTVTSVINPTVGSNTVDVGWSSVCSSHTYPIDRLSPYPCNIFVDVSGTINFTVQELWANVYDYSAPQQTAPWQDIVALQSKTADTASESEVGATAIRIKINSANSGAELQMYTNQVSGAA